MINTKLKLIAEGMKRAEGWIPPTKTAETYTNGSISYRHHNPGNLRSSRFQLGEKDGFAYFLDDEIGMMAMLYDLHAKMTGKSAHVDAATATLYDLLRVWVAPDNEDSFNNYTDIVERVSGVPRDTPVRDIIK